MYCSNCGNKLTRGSKFCEHCGTPLNNVEYDNSTSR
ncbi:zinc-ribbon domain-containing protein [Staphylococcus pasteuri]|nr:zinc-ribbon domain-containing protein [Staphylococcus pasteuri]MDI3232043.1 zinc-ribbon domain-containing protein [Staphylococcus pasteuri]